MEKVFIDLIKKIKKKYGQKILIEYEYSSDSDLHLIWHNNFGLEYNQEFNEFVGSALEKIILEHQIFNFSFAFNEDRIFEILLEKEIGEVSFEKFIGLKLGIQANFSFPDISVCTDKKNYGVLAA